MRVVKVNRICCLIGKITGRMTRLVLALMRKIRFLDRLKSFFLLKINVCDVMKGHFSLLCVSPNQVKEEEELLPSLGLFLVLTIQIGGYR